MLRHILPPAVLAIAGVALVGAAACGGNGDGGTQTNSLTDPAKAVTATPVTGTPSAVYQINSDRVVVITGPTTPAAGTGGSGGGRTHTVAAGETCSEIAGSLGITVEVLIKTNRGINAECSNLRIGETLRAPSTTPTPGSNATPGATNGAGGRATATPKTSDGKVYVVRDGDICDDIALNHGVEVDVLIQINGLDSECRDLKIGQELKIP
ncbi:MAG: LysM peptidoglycan-binding domain-containing protein [Dehalococcoidia bacterium]